MFNWFNMKKKSLPEQVLQNTKDIEKLYDQELSDITQLNYKQDSENSLTYADGKATFKGKMSIIRNENTQNLIVDSDIEVNISSGDDDIIIDAGEDNVSLKIRLDNTTRNKINKALLTPINTPNEREFVAVGTNNAQVMIPESELLKNIRTDIVYDKSSDDYNLNLGFTAGLPAGEYDLNLTKYRYLKIFVFGGYRGACVFVDLENYHSNAYFGTGVFGAETNPLGNVVLQYAYINVNSEKNRLDFNSFNYSQGTAGGTDYTAGTISRIEGVY